jgi:hypothetical protein
MWKKWGHVNNIDSNTISACRAVCVFNVYENTFPTLARDFSLLQNIQTEYGAHPITLLNRYCSPVKENQLMLKGVVSNFFIVLIKLPRHVSASKCHLQGGYSFLVSYSSFSLRFRWMWAIVCSVWPSALQSRWPHQANNSPYLPKTQTKIGVAYKEQVTPLKMTFGCRNMSG